MTDRIVPRCPSCSKRQANWIDGNAGFQCDRCHTEFEFVEGKLLVVRPVKVYTSQIASTICVRR